MSSKKALANRKSDGKVIFDTSIATLNDIRKLINGSDNRGKLDGIKRLISMMSRGQDVASMLPEVVKLVVSTSLEIKKLAYIFLVHYSSVHPDDAIMAVNVFQKDMSHSNQLIRGLALRVMSSIRSRDIIMLIMLSIQKCARDPSPFVRKTAAMAVTKAFNLDPDQKVELVKTIQVLLGDSNTSVMGSAVVAFSQVCPEQLDLLHEHFRRLCHFLADMDEWAQVTTITTLMRYGRSQFTDPELTVLANGGEEDESDSDSELDSEAEDGEKARESLSSSKVVKLKGNRTIRINDLPNDHAMLLRSTRTLLQSRNTGVVLAVATLFYYLAPKSDLVEIGTSLVRVLRSSSGIQYFVLSSVACMAAGQPTMFRKHIKDFFVRGSDTLQIRSLKLEVLTHIAAPENVEVILKELEYYLKSNDVGFLGNVIQAVGRTARAIPAVANRCLQLLMKLLASGSEDVIGDAVVVIKNLLMKDANGEMSQGQIRIVRRFAKLLYKGITSSSAKAAAIWVIGENCKEVPDLAPDCLRTLLQNFVKESDEVKVQILSLGVKLFLHRGDVVEQWKKSDEEQSAELLKIREKEAARSKRRKTRQLEHAKRKLKKYKRPKDEAAVHQLEEELAAVTLSKEEDERRQAVDLEAEVAMRLQQAESISSKIEVMMDYVLQLARFDVNYDIRDRARLSRALLKGEGASGAAAAVAKKAAVSDELELLDMGADDLGVAEELGGAAGAASQEPVSLLGYGERVFLCEKPQPELKAHTSMENLRFTLNTLAHVVEHATTGYLALPEFPLEMPDPKVRDPVGLAAGAADRASDHGGSESDTSDSRSSYSGYSSYDSDRDSEGSSTESVVSDTASGAGSEYSSTPPSSRRSSISSDGGSSEDEGPAAAPVSKPAKTKATKEKAKPKSESEQAATPSKGSGILDLEEELFAVMGGGGEGGDTIPATTLTPQAPLAIVKGDASGAAVNFDIDFERIECLNAIKSNGLQMEYALTRKQSAYSAAANNIRVFLTNKSKHEIAGVVVSKTEDSGDIELFSFPEIHSLKPEQTVEGAVAVDFKQRTRAAKLQVACSLGAFPIDIKPVIGEMVRPVLIPETKFAERLKKLSHMHEAGCEVKIANVGEKLEEITRVIQTAANVAFVSSKVDENDTTLQVSRFSGRTISTGDDVFITLALHTEAGTGKLQVHCNHHMFSSPLMRALRSALSSAF